MAILRSRGAQVVGELAVEQHARRRSGPPARRSSAARWTCRSPTGPSSTMNSPSSTSRLTLSTATVPSAKTLVTSLSATVVTVYLLPASCGDPELTPLWPVSYRVNVPFAEQSITMSPFGRDRQFFHCPRRGVHGPREARSGTRSTRSARSAEKDPAHDPFGRVPVLQAQNVPERPPGPPPGPASPRWPKTSRSARRGCGPPGRGAAPSCRVARPAVRGRPASRARRARSGRSSTAKSKIPDE